MKFRTAIVRSAFLVPIIGAVATRAQAQDTQTRYPMTGSLNPNSTGSHNSAFGYFALKVNTTGSRNTSVGSYTLVKNTTTTDNTAVGFEALRYNNGSSNTAVGAGAMRTTDSLGNPTGSNNTGIGFEALRNNADGYQNAAVGVYALRENTSGGANSALGYNALLKNTTGSANTGVGWGALEKNTTGYENTALGLGALSQTGASVSNTALGTYTLSYTVNGYNTAVGARANASCATGACTHTVAVGYGAVTGQYSTAVGGPSTFSPPSTALDVTTQATGNYAVAVGNGAWATADSSTALGYGAHASGINSMALGYMAKNNTANSVVIGNTAITKMIVGTATVVNTSDGRYKTSIKENVPGLAFITKLRPVTFKWDLGKLNSMDGAEPLASDPILGEGREAKARKVNTGFIAQEVEAAARECGYDFSGVVKPENEQSQYQLGYSEFVVPLVKAVQEQQKEIDELRQALRTLATDGRLPGNRLGQGSAVATWQHAGMLDNFWAGAMTLLSAALVVLHFKRRGASPVVR
jgi:hypothetical protein